MSRELPVIWKLVMFGRIWSWFIAMNLLFRLVPLPRLVLRLSTSRQSHGPLIAPRRLGRAVSRSLSIAGYQPRCLTAALVLFRLLSEQGHSAELVLGLPHEPRDNRAHAWIEVDGLDVGPPPGKQGHAELARYRGRQLGGIVR
jgi:hypothetical protein